MLRFSWVAASALILAGLGPSVASAQFGRGFQMPASVQNILLLRAEAVQKELALTPDQTKSIADLGAKMQSEAIEIMSGLQDLTDEERKEEMPNLMKMISEKGKDLQTQVDKILDAKQTARIKELSIQRRNVAALQDDEVVAALKLSDEQKEKLTAIRDSTAKEQEEIVKGLLSGGGDRSQIRTKMEALQKTVGEKSFAVLTPEQREQFEKMKGAKFNFPPQGRGPGF